MGRTQLPWRPTRCRRGRALHGGLACAAALAACSGAHAQGLRVVPSLTITETITDNRDTRSTGRQADAITQISPAVSVSGRSGLFQGSLNYALNGVLYASESSLNTVYHSLAGTGNLQFVEGRAGVDLSASASRQLVSAFGTQTVDPVLNTGNQAQVFNYSISPYLRGVLLGDVSYQARASYQASSSDAGSTGDASSVSVQGGLAGRVGRINWALDGSRQESSTAQTRKSHNNRVTGSLSTAATPELFVTVRAGWESDDLLSGQDESRMTWGGGLSWTPGPRTSLRADYDRRVYGRSHSVSLSHRMARTYFTVSDNRGLDRLGAGGRTVLTNFDFYFPFFSTLAPAGANKEDFVRELLIRSNINPSAPYQQGDGFLSPGATIRHGQTVSATYQGLRVTLSVVLNQSSSRPYGAESTALSAGTGGRTQQRGISFNLSHRLTPESSLAVTVSQQRTTGDASASGTDLKSITATWTSRLGPYTSVSLGARHSNFDSDVNPYQESALIGSIRMQF